MKFTAEQIAGILEGEVIGNPNAEVSKLSKIEEGTEGSLTFLANPKYINYIYETKATITIVNKTFEPENAITTTLIKVDDAYKAFSKLLEFYNQIKLNKTGIEVPCFLSESAQHGGNFYLGAFSYIGENVVIGKDCTIHSGAIVGADGFGFAPNENGEYSKVPQIGNVIIEDNVDVGAGTTIDRATLGSTVIRKGVKLDNQIQIAHNVEIGENTVIAAQTGVAGSTKIGKNCMIGGQVGIAGHLIVGNGVRIQAQTGVGRNLKDNETLQGSPALAYSDYNKSYVHFKNLPKIVSEIEELKKKNN